MANTEDIDINSPNSFFKWNQKSLDKKQLLLLAEDYLQSGEPFQQSIGQFFKDWFNNSTYIEVQTSGSTGKPKTIKVKKAYMVNSALATGEFFNLPQETTALLCLPATYIAGKLMLVRALVLGWEIDSVQPKSNPFDGIDKRYDFCAMTPFQLDNSLACLHLVEKLIVGGGSVSVQLQRLIQGAKTKIYETYGMTETLTHIAARRINSKEENKENVPFKILKGVEIWQDEHDCLVIEAPNVSDEIIHTNDIVELKTKKEFWLKGRIDNVINSGGIKVHPEEVERKLETIISSRFFISSLPDNVLGEKLILFIEAPFSEKKLNRLNSEIVNLESLARYEKPKKIYFVEHFEETHTGKINRKNTVKAVRL